MEDGTAIASAVSREHCPRIWHMYLRFHAMKMPDYCKGSIVLGDPKKVLAVAYVSMITERLFGRRKAMDFF